jgi:hypothetical protein
MPLRIRALTVVGSRIAKQIAGEIAMKGIIGLLGLVIALGIGAYIYTHSAKEAATAAGGAGSPPLAINIAGVKNDLIAFGNAEKQQYALEGKYLSLDDLRAKGSTLPADRRGPFTYTAEIGDTEFRITATYGGVPSAGAPKSLSIDQTMQIQTQTQ